MSCVFCAEYYEDKDVCKTCDLRGICKQNGEKPLSIYHERVLQARKATFGIPVFPNGNVEKTGDNVGIQIGSVMGYSCPDCGRVVACTVEGERPECPICEGNNLFYIFARRLETINGISIPKNSILGYRCATDGCSYTILFTREGKTISCPRSDDNRPIKPLLSSEGFLIGYCCPSDPVKTTVMLQ